MSIPVFELCVVLNAERMIGSIARLSMSMFWNAELSPMFKINVLEYRTEYRSHNSILNTYTFECRPIHTGAPVAQWVKRWPTDLADRVRSSLEVKSSRP